MAIEVTREVSLQAIGRWRTPFAKQRHKLRIYNASDHFYCADYDPSCAALPSFKPHIYLTCTNNASLPLVATASVDMHKCKPDAVGFCFAQLDAPVPLPRGQYFVVSRENSSMQSDVAFVGSNVYYGLGGASVPPSAIAGSAGVSLPCATSVANRVPGSIVS